MAIVTGTNGNDILNGTTNNDTIKGLRGNDQLFGDDGDDIIDGGDGNDTLDSGIGDDILLGGVGLDTLVGGIGNNRLDGGKGSDDLRGGDGDDTYVVDSAGDIITDTSGIDLVEASASYVLGAGIEGLTLTGKSGISGTGNGLDNTITGNTGANKLFGMAGADTLDGGFGADSMTGGADDDIYIVDNKGDKVFELAGEGADTVTAFTGYTLSAEIENLILGFNSAVANPSFSGTGNALANTILGNVGNNTLDGGGGADFLAGDDGDDTYIVDDTGDAIVDSSGTETARASASYDLGFSAIGVENLVLTGVLSINGTGDAGGNTITGNSAANVLSGGDGDDVLVADALDILDGGNDNDTAMVAFTATLFDVDWSNIENISLTGKAAINATGDGNDNILTGNAGNNTIDGGGGADTIDGGAGTDTLRGGTGDDVYIVNAATGKTIVELGGEGTDEVQSTVTHTLAAEVDNLVLLGVANLNGTGNALINTLTGNAGSNTLDGGLGADALIGTAGNDFFVVDNAGDTVDASGGTGTVLSGISWDLGVNTLNADNLTLTGVAAINGTGTAAGNTITGNSAANLLTGNAGDDTFFADAFDILDGGLDNDTAAVGFTATLANINWTAIENITLTGKAAINATGDGGDNTLTGNSARNTLDGGLGNDTYAITKGDVVIDAGGIDTVLAGFTYTLIAGLENLTLTGIGKINGFGNAAINIIIGNEGINTIDGKGGNDLLIGGKGDDVYVVNNAGVTIFENGGEGTDLVRAAVSTTLGLDIENLVLTGTANINGTGNADSNSLTGNNGNNILDGVTGADVMDGGRGNDTYIVDDAGDVASERGGGIDSVFATDVSFTLGEGIENLTLLNTVPLTPLDGTGNGLANIITGGDGVNTLDGREGKDTLIGGGGDDYYIVDDRGDIILENINEGQDTIESSQTYTLSHDVEILFLSGITDINGTGNALDNTITGNAGINQIFGRDGDDTLAGDAGEDILRGETGDDVLSGGLGRDQLYGGEGADGFTFFAATSFDAVDIIHDYSGGEGDFIDLTDVLAGVYDPLTDNLSDFAAYGNGGRILIDLSGQAGANGWVEIAQLIPSANTPAVLFVA